MKKLYQAAQICLLIFSVIVILSACTQVTEDNFNKVQVGMTLEQVTAILGPPTSTDSVNFMGFSGTTAVWKTQDAEITVLFFNDKVQVKGFKQVENKNQFQSPLNNLNITSS